MISNVLLEDHSKEFDPREEKEEEEEKGRGKKEEFAFVKTGSTCPATGEKRWRRDIRRRGGRTGKQR